MDDVPTCLHNFVLMIKGFSLLNFFFFTVKEKVHFQYDIQNTCKILLQNSLTGYYSEHWTINGLLFLALAKTMSGLGCCSPTRPNGAQKWRRKKMWKMLPISRRQSHSNRYRKKGWRKAWALPSVRTTKASPCCRRWDTSLAQALARKVSFSPFEIVFMTC